MNELVVPVALIAAMSKNRVIGVDNKLPWYLPEDLKFFKAVTRNKPLVMGRATFESIGRPLPNRLNIVVSRDRSFSHEGVRVCHDIESALELADQQAIIDASEEIMVIGGERIFDQTLGYAQRIYLTEVDITLEGDTFFPVFEGEPWQEVERVAGTPEHGPAYDFVRYERRPL